MGLLDKLKSVFSSNDENKEFSQVVDDTVKEYSAISLHFWSPELNKTKVWTENVRNWPDKKKISFILYLLPIIHKYAAGRRSWSSDDPGQNEHYTRSAYITIIFHNKLVMDDDDAINLYHGFTRYRNGDWANIMHWPINLMLNQLEKQRKGKELSPKLISVLENIKKDIKNIEQAYQEKERIKMVEKIDTMLFGPTDENKIKPVKFLGEDELAEFANPMIENIPIAEKLLWYRLLALAQKATGSKPSTKFLNETKNLVKEIGIDNFKKTIHAWMQFLVSLKEKQEQHRIDYGNGQSYTYSSYDYLTSVNAEAMKGLVWTCSHFHDNTTIQTVASLAERAFKKIPGKGPTAASLGNACLYTLYKSKGLDGIGELSRLKLKIKQNSTQNLIERYLQAAAEEQGVTIDEIEDMSVDDAGLTEGKHIYRFDDYTAILEISGIGKTEQRWFKPDGTPQKSVPAAVKVKYAAKLKKLKDTARQVEQTLTGQRDRFDRMLRSDRRIEIEKFRRYYLEHGILSYIARKLIWNFHQAHATVQAINLNNTWVNSDNEIVDIDKATHVSLWHPVHCDVAGIKAWRDFMVFHELRQPLKQAYREVYLLTDAEVNTRSYSNRMAAHILRQHQFNSLAKTRGWRYSLMGGFDNGYDNGTASLQLPEHGLKAEFWINEVADENAMNDTGIWNYVSTDQVRFVNTSTNEVVELIAVPALVLTEVLRDVDLFVGVASVGNDPAWQDSGGLPAYRDYWQSYSFGDLSELAKNRKEILSSLLPKLKIRELAEIRDKFLVVKGKLRTYKIHLGSTNILMEPNDQYLCIVPDRSAKDHTEKVFLPFEGDTALSVILSKAFLLADDNKITDTTITSQINRK
jgi:hypothetical protein